MSNSESAFFVVPTLWKGGFLCRNFWCCIKLRLTAGKSSRAIPFSSFLSSKAHLHHVLPEGTSNLFLSFILRKASTSQNNWQTICLTTVHDFRLCNKGLIQSFDLQCYPCKHLHFSDKMKYNSTPEVSACFLQPLKICLLNACHYNPIL